MTWVDEFFGRVNRKCANCGKLLLDENPRTVDGAKICSDWCTTYYREHRLDDEE